MANRYWVGGTGSWDGTNTTNWSTASGGAGGASVPTTADAVIFDANSGTGTATISAGNTGALSLTTTNYSGTLAGSANITIAGSITIGTTTTYSYTGGITITGTGTLTSNGKTFRAITINGTAITVSLGSALTVANGNYITVTSGTFTTTAGAFNIIGDVLSIGNSGTVTLNASTVDLSGQTQSAIISTGTGVLNAGTSQINITGVTLGLNCSHTFNNVSFTSVLTGNSTIFGACTFNNLTITAPSAGGVRQISLSANQTINGTLTCAGASAIRRISLQASSVGVQRTITAAAISATDCDFRDINLAGAATGATPTRAGNCGGNTGINFPAAKTVYWNLTGSQGWGSTAWATTSGGTPALNNFPLAQDTAVFDNTGAATDVAFNATFNIGTIDASGRTTAMSISGSFPEYIYGSVTFGTGVSVTSTTNCTFFGAGAQTFSISGSTNLGIYVNKPAGVSFTLNSAVTTGGPIVLLQGTFDANNYNVTCLSVNASNSNVRTLTMGSGLWTLVGSGGTIWTLTTTSNLTFNVNTANILLSNSTSARTFSGGGKTYNKITIGGTTGGSSVTFNDSGTTLGELAATQTTAHTIIFNNDYTIGVWSVSGSAGNVVTVSTSSPSSPRTVTLASGFVSGVDYLSVNSLIASPVSDAWYIGSNSTYSTTPPNTGYGFLLTSRNVRKVFVLTSTTSTTWTVPADWNNANNEIHLIGGGGGGAGSRVASPNKAGGGGGGGGGYTKLVNQTLTPGASITYQAGAAGTAGAASGDGGAGGTTSWNSGAATAGGGGGGQATTAPSSTGGTGGIGSTENGGAGGVGATTTTSTVGVGGGGGGSAGSMYSFGKVGGAGFGSAVSTEIAGGGGAGGGGSPGGNATAGVGGTGGTNAFSVGGGPSNTSGAVGGGGGGSVSASSVGSAGIEVYGVGSGGGGGGQDDNVRTNTGGLYGGGGGGAATTTGVTIYGGSAGAQGAIIITYSTQTNTGNFFFMMGA